MRFMHATSNIRTALWGCGVILFLTATARAQVDDAARRSRAEPLFAQGMELFKRHDYAGACPKFEEVVRLLPDRVGAQLQLALCYEATGRTLSARRAYERALVLAQKVSDPRQSHAAEQIVRLGRLVPTLRLAWPVAQEGVEVRLDGRPLTREELERPIAVDPGAHAILASAPGHETWQTTLEVPPGTSSAAVEIPQLAATPASGPLGAPPVEGSGVREASRTAPLSLRWGALARADIDGGGRGFAAVLGISGLVLDRVELDAAALLAGDKGAELSGTLYLLRGELRPSLSLGVPLFFHDGVSVGVHPMAGLLWMPTAHVGAFVQGAVAFFPSTPATYDRLVILPSLGVRARL
jgi:tetratricopeptide (TPR) repeat protein